MQIQQRNNNRNWAYKQQQHKINTSFFKLLTTVTRSHKESKNTIHHKVKKYTMQHNNIQKKYLKIIRCFLSINH